MRSLVLHDSSKCVLCSAGRVGGEVGGGGEAELAVGGEAFAGHGDENGHVGVVVVVPGNVGQRAWPVPG